MSVSTPAEVESQDLEEISTPIEVMDVTAEFGIAAKSILLTIERMCQSLPVGSPNHNHEQSCAITQLARAYRSLIIQDE